MNTQHNNPTMPSAMQAAIHSANILSEQKTKEKQVENTDAPLIIPCVDLLGNKIVVMADSLDTEKNTVQFYNLKQGNKPQTIDAAYYKSAKKIKDKTEVTKLVQDFSKATGVKSVVLRERLVKESARRQADVNKPGDAAAANKEFADKLISAITVAINKALAV